MTSRAAQRTVLSMLRAMSGKGRSIVGSLRVLLLPVGLMKRDGEASPLHPAPCSCLATRLALRSIHTSVYDIHSKSYIDSTRCISRASMPFERFDGSRERSRNASARRMHVLRKLKIPRMPLHSSVNWTSWTKAFVISVRNKSHSRVPRVLTKRWRSGCRVSIFKCTPCSTRPIPTYRHLL